MKFLRSIRWRLQLWHGLLLALVLACFGFTAWRLQLGNQLRRTDEALQQRVSILTAIRRAANPAGNGPPDRFGPPPFPKLSANDASLFEERAGKSFYFVVWSPDGFEVARSHSAPAKVSHPERQPGPMAARLRGTLREFYSYTPPGECFLAGVDIRDELGDLRRFAWLLAGIGSLVLLSAWAGGWWISGRAIRPITDISNAAEKISTGDLTQRIQTEDADSELGQLAQVLNSTFARLEAAFNQQARFTADAAHELRTPVTVMLTHVQNGLASECPNEEHREAFEASQRAAQRMRRLTESLLTLARLDSGGAAALHAPCDLDRIAREAVELLRPLAKDQGISLAVEPAPARCNGDAEQLGQVVSNLVNNAIAYNRRGGSVLVKLAADAEAAVLSVSDTGQGIGTEDLPHIFERFYRADQTRSNLAGHTGLGLAIVKAIIEAHGGNVQVESETGKGSTFTVRLPAGLRSIADPAATG
jgi:two-component system, OmpR family, sensor kinase